MEDAFLCRSGFYIKISKLRELFKTQYNGFLAKMTIVRPPTFASQTLTKTQLYRIHGQYMCIPRGYIGLFKKYLKITNLLPALEQTDSLVLAAGSDDIFAVNEKLRPYQREIVEMCMARFSAERVQAGEATAYLDLKAGYGKTFIALGIVAQIAARFSNTSTLIVVPQCELKKQFEDAISVLFCADAGANFRPPKITIRVINGLLKEPPEYFQTFSAVIFDEVHMYCSPTRKNIFKLAGAPIMLGMSATSNERLDGLDVISHRELIQHGDTLIRATPIAERSLAARASFDLNVRAIHYYGPPEYTKPCIHETTGNVFMPYMYKQLMSDPRRTEILIDEIEQLYNWRGSAGQQHSIFVFCAEREPLMHFRELLTARLGADVSVDENGDENGDENDDETDDENADEIADGNGPAGLFIGGISEKESTEIKKNARILLTTFGFSSTGISIPRMTAIVFLTPRKSKMRQIVGRILRTGSDTSIPRVVVDLIDASTFLTRQFRERKKTYEYYGAKIEYIHCN